MSKCPIYKLVGRIDYFFFYGFKKNLNIHIHYVKFIHIAVGLLYEYGTEIYFLTKVSFSSVRLFIKSCIKDKNITK